MFLFFLSSLFLFKIKQYKYFNIMLYFILIILYIITITNCTQQQKPLTALPAIKPLPFTEPWLHLLEQYYNMFHGENNNVISLQEQCAYSLPDFNCHPFIHNDGISDAKRNAYHIRPQDIKLVIALGDSITAGFGMISRRPPFSTILEYRGKVFSIGGDKDEYTIPQFLSTYSSTYGSPEGVTLPLSRGKDLNNAVSGAKVQELDQQVDRLLHHLKYHYHSTNVKNQWKLITLFIGANNICVLCTPPITRLPGLADVEIFDQHIRDTLENLRSQVGKSIVNLVALFNISSVYEASRGNPYCEMVLDPNHMVICSCLQESAEQRIAADLVVKEYNKRLEKIAYEYHILHDPNFSVNYQPGFQHFPVAKYKQRYLSKFDCFHPNRCANQVMSLVLWNNMFSNNDEKNQLYQLHNLTFICPSKDRPYLQ
ncbi:unnamed protein product [Cunninghamella blakesleeana]